MDIEFLDTRIFRVRLMIVLVVLFSFPAVQSIPHCNSKESLVWGPGLWPNATLPVGYFFIQARDDHGNNITESLGKEAFQVELSASEDSRPRVWLQMLDRNDGSYIVRYKLMRNYEDLVIRVQYKDSDVAESPYKLQGWSYSETCNCPEPDMSAWLSNMKCPDTYEQIQTDLKEFSNINMRSVEKSLTERYNQRGQHSLCHYVIKDNRIYRKTYGQHVGFKMFMDSVLLSITRKVRLPDMEFFLNLGDWPLERRESHRQPMPLLSWCGSTDTRDIVLPTYDITESTLETMGRVSLDMLSVQGNTGPRWGEKSSQGFWRGRDSRQERLDLVKMSIKNPDLLDAKLTNMFFFKHSPDLGDIVKSVSFYDFFKYKYQINIDGTVAAYRLPYLLAGDSLVLKQDSNYYEHFYPSLKPYEHYVPFKRDLSDLLSQLKWAREHDKEARQIARNAQEFVRENLLAQNVFCYHVVLFNEYARRLVSEVTVQGDMEEVTQPDKSNECMCERRRDQRKRKDEL